MYEMNIEECRLKYDFEKVFSGLYANGKLKDTIRDLRQVIQKHNRNCWLEHADYYHTIKNKKNFNYIKMRTFLKQQYKHTDYFRLEQDINTSKDKDIYRQILTLWKKHLRSAMITYAELKKQHDFNVQNHRKTHLTEKVQCSCGKMISRGNILKHMNTKAHLQKVN